MGFARKMQTAKEADSARASAAVMTIGRDGATVRLVVALTRRFATDVKNRADAFLGDGEDEGSVLLKFGDEGAFKVVKRTKGRTEVRMPVPSCVPSGFLFSFVKCETDVRGDDLLVRLPIKAWRDTLKKHRGKK